MFRYGAAASVELAPGRMSLAGKAGAEPTGSPALHGQGGLHAPLAGGWLISVVGVLVKPFLPCRRGGRAAFGGRAAGGFGPRQGEKKKLFQSAALPNQPCGCEA